MTAHDHMSTFCTDIMSRFDPQRSNLTTSMMLLPSDRPAIYIRRFKSADCPRQDIKTIPLPDTSCVFVDSKTKVLIKGMAREYAVGEQTNLAIVAFKVGALDVAIMAFKTSNEFRSHICRCSNVCSVRRRQHLILHMRRSLACTQ